VFFIFVFTEFIFFVRLFCIVDTCLNSANIFACVLLISVTGFARTPETNEGSWAFTSFFTVSVVAFDNASALAVVPPLKIGEPATCCCISVAAAAVALACAAAFFACASFFFACAAAFFAFFCFAVSP
jgi:hypothetical protein